MESDKVFDQAQWKKEAEAVIRDIECGVREAKIAQNLHSSDSCIYWNVTTVEGDRFCIELTRRGFRVVGRNHDCNSDKDDTYYETPYALLNHLSVAFRERFGKSLMTKLQAIKDLESDRLLRKHKDCNADGT